MASIYEYKGKWRAQVRRRGFPTTSELFDTKREAERWAARTERAMLAGDYHPPTDTTLRQLLDRYAAEVSPTHKGARWEQVRIALFKRSMRFLDLPAEKVGPDEVRDWRDRRVKEVSGSSVNREMNLLSAVFSHAIKEWGVKLPTNPVHLVARPPRGKPRKRRVSAEDLAALWAASGVSQTEPPRFQKDYVPWMVEFGVETAMRMSEMCRLKWSDVYLEEGWAHVGESKNGTTREIALTSRAVEILRLMPRGEHVFARNSGTVGLRFRELVKAAGLKDLHFHDSRREGATRLSAKLDVLELAAQTGHQDVNTLRRVYYAPSGASLAKKLRRSDG